MGTTPQCTNSECHVSETGKCVLGKEPNQCEHFGAAGNESAVNPKDTEIAEEVALSLALSLHSGECLSVEAAADVLRAGDSRVLAIVGPTSSGKTSLIASFYHLFLQDKNRALDFVKSETLPAFERTCHDARAASRRQTPQTEHTPHSLLPFGVCFYHLGVRGGKKEQNLELLLADRTGEDYSSAADNPALAADFIEIRRADSVTILVDGKKLLDSTARHSVKTDIEMILQGLIDGGVLLPSHRLALVLTKVDLIMASAGSDGERARRDFDSLYKKLKEIFDGKIQEPLRFEIAASPETTIVEHGFGLQALAEFWVSDPIAPKVVLPPIEPSGRAISRFSLADEGGSDA